MSETGLKSESSASYKVTSIVPYFGAKRFLSAEIVAQFGPHSMYWEPFCGSLAVVLAKKPSPEDNVNDIYGPVINLARVVASDRYCELYDRLSRTMSSIDIFEGCRDKWMDERDEVAMAPMGERPSDEQLETAYRFFVVSWMGVNGVTGTKKCNYHKAKRWSPGGGSGAVRWCSAVDSMPAWHQRLRRINIHHMDGFEVLAKITDHPKTVIYMDPPYIIGGDRSSGARYCHEFADSDHERLAGLARRFKQARAIISYYDNERLADMYKGWTKKTFDTQSTMAVAVTGKRKSVKEILLINGPCFAKGETDLFGG